MKQEKEEKGRDVRDDMRTAVEMLLEKVNKTRKAQLARRDQTEIRRTLEKRKLK